MSWCRGVTARAPDWLIRPHTTVLLKIHAICWCCVLVQEGDPEGWWEETFNGHTDSKPSGPEAISIDLKFPGYKHVYGLPERATNFSLQPTAGVLR
jgi:hypothetical protein